MKKIISFSFITLFLIGFIFSLSAINYASAAGDFSFTLFTEDRSTDAPNNVAWDVIIHINPLKGTKLDLSIYENGSLTPLETKYSLPIAHDTGNTEYRTGYILKPNTSYSITVLIPGTAITGTWQKSTKSYGMQNLSATVDKPNLNTNDIAHIKVTTSDKKVNIPITFTVSPTGPSIKGATNEDSKCTTYNVAEGSCSVTFVSTTPGDFTVSYFSAGTYTAGKTKINVSVTLPPSNTPLNTDTSYKPLAPIPGVVEKGGSYDTTKGFGDYLNKMILVFIGICAILAFVMIVMSGLQYITSELISSKEAARDQLMHAILGLLLALGAYAILNTLNPQLLDVGLNQLPQAQITIQDDAETASDAVTTSATPPTSSKLNLCNQGIGKVTTKGGNVIWVCNSYVSRIQALVDAAWAATPSLKLSGGGYRTTTQQEGRRAANCGGSANVYNKNATCNPPTAFPGTSRHESGLAVDFSCNGVLIKTQSDPCFVWLSNNSSLAGFKNFAKEPWHWSFDGR